MAGLNRTKSAVSGITEHPKSSCTTRETLLEAAAQPGATLKLESGAQQPLSLCVQLDLAPLQWRRHLWLSTASGPRPRTRCLSHPRRLITTPRTSFTSTRAPADCTVSLEFLARSWAGTTRSGSRSRGTRRRSRLAEEDCGTESCNSPTTTSPGSRSEILASIFSSA